MDNANDKAVALATEVSRRLIEMRQQASDLLLNAKLWDEQGDPTGPELGRLADRWYDLLEAMSEVLHTADNLRLQAQDNNRQERAAL